MVKELITIKVEIYTKVVGLKTGKVDKEYINGLMEMNMKENILKVKDMAKVNININVAVITKEVGRTDKDMVLVSQFQRRDINMKEIS